MPHKVSKTERSDIAKKAWRKRKRDMTGKTNRRTRKNVVAKTRPYKKRSRRRTTLSQMINPMQANAGFRAAGNGALGGGLAALIEKILKPEMPDQQKALWLAAVGFGIATLARAPYIGAGVAAVAGYKLMSEVGLAQNALYADPLEQLPMMLDAAGQPMALAEDETGGLYLEENNMYLEENDALDYQVPYAPDFGAAYPTENELY